LNRISLGIGRVECRPTKGYLWRHRRLHSVVEDRPFHYEHVYAQLAPQPPAASPAAQPGPEHVLGLAVGHLEDRIPEAWGTPAPSRFPLERRTLAVATYPVGGMTLA
jgi:hypothetical protein